MIYSYIFAFILSFIIAFSSTPFVKKLAFKVGAVDVPKDERRIHNHPIARLGGLAIFLGFIVSFLAFSEKNGLTFGFLAGGIIILILGIIDDIKPLNAKVKLVFQIIAASIVTFSGVRIEAITNPFASNNISSLNYFGIPVIITILWIVGVTNAVNLIDGLDGLAAGISSIASIFLLFIALINGKVPEAIFTAALAGSALGFLPYNFNPAKIFMGDTGATFLGYSLAFISIQGTMKGYTAIAISVPLLVLGLPIFDTTFAILRRIIQRKPVMQADRGHLHHRLIDAGYSQKQSVLMLYTISTFLGISALVVTDSAYARLLIVVATISIFLLVGLKYFKGTAQDR